MSKRLDLHEILVTILGSRNVYFQPPSNVQIKYPCIVYSRSEIATQWANDQLYKHKVGYMITVIDANPDSSIPEKILSLPLCRYDRPYTANNLNHDVFNLYY